MKLTKRVTRILLALVALGILSGCGATKQFMIPRTTEGELAGDPKWKLRLSLCANCYMWRGQSISPRGFLTIHEDETVRVETHSSYRCFEWLLIIPVPIWSSCSPSLREPRSQIVRIRITNLTDGAFLLKQGKVRAYTLDEQPLIVRGNQVIPDAIPPGESIQFSLGVGDWPNLGKGFELDFSDVTPYLSQRISFERFTSTTFGLLYLN